jgi:rhamnogalacturonyl hydrolase YesR
MRAIIVLLSLLVFAAPAPAEEPLALAGRVADWQLGHVGTPIANQRPETYEPRGWVMGAFYVGLTALAERSPRYVPAVIAAGQAQGFGLGSRPYHADDHVIAQSWIWAYERTRDPKMIAPVRAAFDAILATPPTVALDFADPPGGGEPACQTRWCWCDALFMGPPGWFELTRATGDARYAAYADKEFRATADKLYSAEEHLFYRDSRFFDRKGPHGEKIFWARGNGWVYAGLARILQFIPADAPERPYYVALFRAMSAKLVALQKPDGYWPVSLLGPGTGTRPETSGTGFFTFGLAYGVASDLLGPEYRAAAEKGWAALARAVEPDGKLGFVQPIGAAPDAVAREDTHPFGVGAFLLAATAVADMRATDHATVLKATNPLERPRLARIDIPKSLLPRDGEGAWVALTGEAIAPLQFTSDGAVTVLPLPAKATVRLTLRPRLASDPIATANARATIPVKDGDHYREAASFVVPPTHTIHDPLLPIEGAGWESDRVGFRVYLDKRFVVDIYGKKDPAPVLHTIGQGGPSYHQDAPWGMDIWRAGDSLGAGGLGLLKNGKAVQIGELSAMTASIPAQGPVLGDVHVAIDGVEGKSLAADFSIAAGSRISLNRASAPGLALVAGFGIWPNTVAIQSPPHAKGWHYFASWGRQSDDGKDDVGVALFYPPGEIARTGDDGISRYIVFRNPAKARYGFGAAWARETGGIASEADFRLWLDRTAEELASPVTVSR